MSFNSGQSKWLDRYILNWLIATMIIMLITPMSEAQLPSAMEVITKSIEYHDPLGTWNTERKHISLAEKRPNGSQRNTKITIDLEKEYFQLSQIREQHHIVTEILADATVIKLDGKTPTDTALIKKFRLDSDRMVLMRDYYVYLYGLPMKLQDPGTIIDPNVQDTSFQDKEVYGIRVTYTPEVGGDIWYFYFDKNNYALSGYRFYHVEADNDGEYITLEGEVKKGNFKLPKHRKWFTHKEGKFLGEDIIVEIN